MIACSPVEGDRANRAGRLATVRDVTEMRSVAWSELASRAGPQPRGEARHRAAHGIGRRGGVAEAHPGRVVAPARGSGGEGDAVGEAVLEEAEDAPRVEAIAHVEEEEGRALGRGAAEHA